MALTSRKNIVNASKFRTLSSRFSAFQTSVSKLRDACPKIPRLKQEHLGVKLRLYSPPLKLRPMTTFMTERALLLNQLKNLKKSLKHFKKRARSFDEETLDDLLHEKIQILEHYEVIISHIEEAVALKKAEIAEFRNQTR